MRVVDQSGGGFDSIRLAVLFLGFLLVLAGAVVMLYLAALVYVALNTPADVPIVNFIVERINVGDLAFYGKMENPNDPSRPMAFEIRWDSSIRTLSFFFLGIAACGILAQILKALLTGGVSLMRFAMGEPAIKKDDVR